MSKCNCGVENLSKPESIKPDWHDIICPVFAPRSYEIPEGLSELELEAFKFYNPDPNWRSEMQAKDFAKLTALFVESLRNKSKTISK